MQEPTEEDKDLYVKNNRVTELLYNTIFAVAALLMGWLVADNILPERIENQVFISKDYDGHYYYTIVTDKCHINIDKSVYNEIGGSFPIQVWSTPFFGMPKKMSTRSNEAPYDIVFSENETTLLGTFWIFPLLLIILSIAGRFIKDPSAKKFIFYSITFIGIIFFLFIFPDLK